MSKYSVDIDLKDLEISDEQNEIAGQERLDPDQVYYDFLNTVHEEIKNVLPPFKKPFDENIMTTNWTEYFAFAHYILTDVSNREVPVHVVYGPRPAKTPMFNIAPLVCPLSPPT